MADEQEQSPAEQADAETQAAEPVVEMAPAPVAGSAAASPARLSGTLFGLAVVAVLLTLAGIFAQMKKNPDFSALGLGLLLWGILDLLAQRRGLVQWRGPKALVGNTLNLIRGLGLLGVGIWLFLMAMGSVHRTNSAVLVDVGAGFLVAYLVVALSLEMMVKGAALAGQAFLLAALGLQFIGFLYFSIPFTFGLAAIFAGLGFGFAGWAVYRNVLAETPALSRAILIATLALGAPLCTYVVQQMFFTEEQPLFTPTLLIPRMRQVVGGLGEDASQIKWAPVHTKVSQPGDVPFSDKLAFTDYRDDEPGLGLYVQREDKAGGDLTWIKTGDEAKLTGFSDDGRFLAFTEAKDANSPPRLGVLGPSGDTVSPWDDDDSAADPDSKESAADKHKRKKAEKEAAQGGTALYTYTLHHPFDASVEPGPDHNEVWRGLGRQLYFASPSGAPKTAGSTVFVADLKNQVNTRVQEARGMPAISPDGKILLTVGFEPNTRYLEIADGYQGERDPRSFEALQEKHYFPAWNVAQTRVIFLKNNRLYTMKSNGNDQEPFNGENLDSKVWLSDKTAAFTLQWKETGDIWKIYRSDPDGHHEKMLYEARTRAITAPAWSPDGKRIAFIQNGDDESSIITFGPQAEWPRHFFITKDPLREIRWSPDSLKLAWFVDRGIESQEAWTAADQGLDPVKVFQSRGDLETLSWARDGKHLAFEESLDWRFLGIRVIKPDLHDVQVVDLVENKARVMTRYGLMSRQPSFSPQGDAIAYFTDDKPWSPGFLRERSTALVLSQLY